MHVGKLVFAQVTGHLPLTTFRRCVAAYGGEHKQRLIGIAGKLYLDEPFGVDLKETLYALDATTIDLCLSVFPWAPFRSTKAAVKAIELVHAGLGPIRPAEPDRPTP